MTDIDTKSAIADAADALTTATKGVNAIPPAWVVAVSVLGAGILIAKAIGAAAVLVDARLEGMANRM
jgi:hypothetical protein